MNRQPIGYLKWIVYVICYIFLYLYNKELALICLLSHTLSKDTQNIYQQSSLFIHLQRKLHNTYINLQLHTYYHLRNSITLSTKLTSWLVYGPTKYHHYIYYQKHLHKPIKAQYHNTPTFQYLQILYHPNKFNTLSSTLTLWLSLLLTPNQLQPPYHATYGPQTQEESHNTSTINQYHLRKLMILKLTHIMNSCLLGYHKWLLPLRSYTAPLPYNQKLTTLLGELASYINMHKNLPATRYICILTIILLLPTTHIHTKSPIPHNTTHSTIHTQNIIHTIHKATNTVPHYNHTLINHTINPQYTPPNKLPIPHIIINNVDKIGNICYITHLHLKTPKNKPTQYYTWNNSTIILLSGDIQLNPGPVYNILKNLPQAYTKRQKQYFLPDTLTLKPQYTHLEKLFEPHLSHTTTNPQNPTLTHLRTHSLLLSQYPTHHIRYALIIVYSPLPQICNQLMSTKLDPRYLTILRRLQALPIDTYSTPTHINNYPLINTTTTTITQAYSNINDKIARGIPITLNSLRTELPHLPTKILQELTKCSQPIIGHHPPSRPINNQHTPPSDTRPHNPQTQTLNIITWNTGCISTSLPGIQELTRKLHPDPHIILIQETKIPKTKSTSYIDRQLKNYKLIYNNSNSITQSHNRYSGPTQTRGGILTMIPKSIYTNENISKIPTPSHISPYLQAILIKNKPLTPILILNMYMPTHPQDIHIIPDIQNQILTLMTQHANHQTILAGDFNRDILLKGRIYNGIPTTPNHNDQEWARFTQANNLNVVPNPKPLTRQGGHNYTSTSHIDGFYTNTSHTPNLISHTITNLNQNSDHYPVQLQLNPNSIIIKDHNIPTNQPRITYPIPPKSLQTLQITFLEKQNLAIENLTKILQQDHLTHTQWENAQTTLQDNH